MVDPVFPSNKSSFKLNRALKLSAAAAAAFTAADNSAIDAIVLLFVSICFNDTSFAFSDSKASFIAAKNCFSASGILMFCVDAIFLISDLPKPLFSSLNFFKSSGF